MVGHTFTATGNWSLLETVFPKLASGNISPTSRKQFPTMTSMPAIICILSSKQCITKQNCKPSKHTVTKCIRSCTFIHYHTDAMCRSWCKLNKVHFNVTLKLLRRYCSNFLMAVFYETCPTPLLIAFVLCGKGI